MTREEAIEIIKRYDVNFCDSDGKPISAELLAQSFEMAIKSLEAWEKIKKEIKQIRIHCGYLDVQGVTIIEVLEIIDKHLSEVSK